MKNIIKQQHGLLFLAFSFLNASHVVAFTIRITSPGFEGSLRLKSTAPTRIGSKENHMRCRMYNNSPIGESSVEAEVVKEQTDLTNLNEVTVKRKKDFSASLAANIAKRDSHDKEKTWNTSIFPTKQEMAPAVEKNNFTLQIYIQAIAGIIGIMTGVLVSVFKLSIDEVRQFCYEGSFFHPDEKYFPFFLVPVIGSIGVALLSLTGEFSPGIRGVVKEVDEDSLAIQFKDEMYNELTDYDIFEEELKTSMRALRKSLAAIVTLGTGNSLGPEGPGVEIGAAVSRFGMLLWPRSLLKDKKATTIDGVDIDNGIISRNRLLLACGAAAGVSSGFNAPLSGVFFALEVVQASLQPVNVPSRLPEEADTRGISSASKNPSVQLQQQSLSADQASITAILISSVLAALAARDILGNDLALTLVTYQIRTPLIELPLYIFLGLSCGLVSVIFTQGAKFFKNVFEGEIGPEPVQDVFRAVPAPALPIFGGLTCGIVGYFYPQILFFGYDTLNRLLMDKNSPIELLVSLLVAKTFATAVSAGSGLVGGTLAPSLFLGGMTGALFHNIANDFFTMFHIPETITSSSGIVFDLAGVPAYSMVGAASVLAAVFRAPLTASLLMFEITRNYDVLLPLLASAGVASLFSDLLLSELNKPKN